jgi:C1A family cysteine protease
MTKDEMNQFTGKGRNRSNKKRHAHPFVKEDAPEHDVLSTDDLPKTFDWREKVKTDDPDAVMTVRSQGECGSCWAFTTAYALEFYNWIAGG